jgi:hypothetical protein
MTNDELHASCCDAIQTAEGHGLDDVVSLLISIEAEIEVKYNRRNSHPPEAKNEAQYFNS